MKYDPLIIDRIENTSQEAMYLKSNTVKINPGARIIESTLLGPTYLNKNTHVGPNVTLGKYFGMNESGFIARAQIGAFCAFGARTAINPFNHPTNWLSTNEFQYHPNSFDWVEEYRDFIRLDRTPDMFERVSVGNDVWTGHNVCIMPGVSIGDGAVIGAGSIVTRDVPPYAIVAGAPAMIKRYRFDEKIIHRLIAVRWWDFELSQLSGLPFRDIERCLGDLERLREEVPINK